MDGKRNIVIDVDNSLYAHGFRSEQQIHQEDLEKAMGIIRRQLESTDVPDEQSVYLAHHYRTIGVFGDRGSGKTSFMISLLNRCKDELKDAEVLRMIDPTLVEHKKPIILSVISMISQRVESVLRAQECSTSGSAYERRRLWEKALAPISSGILAIEDVGQDYNNSMWQDDAYVMNTGLAKVNDANEFEANLRKLIILALEILGKKAFILAFDDTDVDVNQGWKVLETLRRYLSDTHIISIVSGNIKLYGALVRHGLCRNLAMPEGSAREMMENELESQYMLKLLNPSNRINLLSLNQLLSNADNIVKVRIGMSNETDLVSSYKDILTRFGITDSASQKTFKDFLQSMSLRSQIHFLKDACSRNESKPPLDVFTSRLYSQGIDVEALNTNIKMINIALLEYLNRNRNMPDCYLLMPTLADKDMNSNFTAMTLLECWNLKSNPNLAFDYMLRIGYVRNIILPLTDNAKRDQFCKYAGWNQLMSLKNNMGLTMAYVDGKQWNSMKQHIPLFAMEGKAKKGKETQKNALDNALKEEGNSALRLLAMFPFIRITHSVNNESRSYYSLPALIAVIGDILRCESKDEMIGRISDLKLFRAYQIPQDEANPSDESIVDSENFGVETTQDDIDNLAQSMDRWKAEYQGCMLPPYVLGRIMTRLYSSLPNVETASVGQMMNVMVANFFNACLIEETKAKCPASEQGEINNSNLRSDTRYFKDNLGKTDILSKLNFTRWMMSCPMLSCFLEPGILAKAQGSLPDASTGSVYQLLCKISSKKDSPDDNKPSFSGEKNSGWRKSAVILLKNGIGYDDIQKSIIGDEIDKAVEFIKKTDLFGTVFQSSVESFRQNYKREVIAGELLPDQHE